MLKKTNELDINYFIKLAENEVGKTYDLEFQSFRLEKAGKFTILSFEENEPQFKFKYWKHKDDDTPDGADLGYYRVRLYGTKFYNGKEIRVRVSAYVQNEQRGINDMLFINNYNEDTGKCLKAYKFPIINRRQ